MENDNNIIGPYELVAQALGCDISTLSKKSGLNRHPKWDSFGYLQIIMALEQLYGLEITDEDVLKYSNMPAIIDLYEDLAKSYKKVEDGEKKCRSKSIEV